MRRSSQAEDRPALFAAQFALSHACWLVTYPVAGWVGAKAGMPTAFLLLAAIAATAVVTAVALWPANDPEVLEHAHDELPSDDPHLAGAIRSSEAAHRHAHAFVIDNHHP